MQLFSAHCQMIGIVCTQLQDAISIRLTLFRYQKIPVDTNRYQMRQTTVLPLNLLLYRHNSLLRLTFSILTKILQYVLFKHCMAPKQYKKQNM